MNNQETIKKALEASAERFGYLRSLGMHVNAFDMDEARKQANEAFELMEQEKMLTEKEVKEKLETFCMEVRKLFQKHTDGMTRSGQQAGIPSTQFGNDLRAAKNAILSDQ